MEHKPAFNQALTINKFITESTIMSYWNFLDNRVKGNEKGTPWFVNDKLKAYDLLTKLEIPRPEIYDHFEIHQLAEKLLYAPDNLVIKPNNLHSANGVLPLIKNGEYWFDLLRSRPIKNNVILSEQKTAYQNTKYKSSHKIIFEQLILDESNKISPDFKIFAFKNGVPVVLRIDRNGADTYFTLYDKNLEIYDPKEIMDSSWKQDKWIYCYSPAPSTVKNLYQYSARILAELKTNFIRVDCYIEKENVYIGELTPAPGPEYYKKYIHFNREFDSYLGSFL